MINQLNFVTVIFLLLSKRLHICEYTETEKTVTKNTNKYCFLEVLLNKESHYMFLNHITRNLSACFQINVLLIRNQTACFGRSGFYFAGSYCKALKLGPFFSGTLGRRIMNFPRDDWLRALFPTFKLWLCGKDVMFYTTTINCSHKDLCSFLSVSSLVTKRKRNILQQHKIDQKTEIFLNFSLWQRMFER